MSGFDELLESGNLAIADAAMKCESVFHDHERALVSISGGADSDVMLDLCERVRRKQPIEIVYAWFDTGMEYKATKEHLDYLEKRYGVEIERHRAKKTIPTSCREHGQPFINKHVSEMCERLQSAGFQWEDEPFDVLLAKYPKRTVPLRWWCNAHEIDGVPQGRFNIMRNKWLKEFMVANPPQFPISAKCCTFAKKLVGRGAGEGEGCRPLDNRSAKGRGRRQGIA